jgi:transcriptional regulator with XRE-family HTH domain
MDESESAPESEPELGAEPGHGRPFAHRRPATPLGEIIRRQRELSKLSMRHLARTVGISNPYLSQIERGLREPSERVLDGIAAALELSSDALYAEAGAGYEQEDAEPSAVTAAIRADPRLSTRQRQAMIEVYEAFVAGQGRARRRRR